MLKLISLTAVAIVTAEALVMLFLESIGGPLSLPLRVLVDSALLLICVFPALFRQELDNHSTFLVSPQAVDGDDQPLQMRFGAKLEWDGQSATLLMFSYRRDLAVNTPQKVCLT